MRSAPSSITSQRSSRPTKRWRWFLILGVGTLCGMLVAIPLWMRSHPTSHEPTNIARSWHDLMRLSTRGGTVGLSARLPIKLTPSQQPTQIPQVLYIGAEWCPFCAAQRWPLIIALSRFGHWSHPLQPTESAAFDIYPNTVTWTFYRSHYVSHYISLTTLELAGRTKGPNGLPTVLEKPSPLIGRVWTRLDAPPFSSAPGQIPFVLVGSRYLWIGSNYAPSQLSHLNWAQVVHAIRHQNPLGRTIMSNANLMTAAMCLSDHNEPSNVCTIPAVQHYEKQLKAEP